MTAAERDGVRFPSLVPVHDRAYAIFGNTYPVREIIVSEFRRGLEVPRYSPRTGAWHFHAAYPALVADFCKDPIIQEITGGRIAAVHMSFEAGQTVSRSLFWDTEKPPARYCPEEIRAVLHAYKYEPCPTVEYTILSCEDAARRRADFLPNTG